MFSVYSFKEIYQYEDKENNAWQEFINKDYAKVIRNIHKLIRKNRKFVDKSKDYKNKTPMQEQKTITECYDYSDLIACTIYLLSAPQHVHPIARECALLSIVRNRVSQA